MDALRAVNRVAARIAPGRFPSFAEAHVVKALEDIGLHQIIGRIKLSRDLDLGEGEARTLVKHLKKEGLVGVSKSGIFLSTAGRELLGNLRAHLSEQIEIPSTSLTVGSFNVAVQVIGMKNSVKYGLEQRDAAIMAGAKGATTLIFTNAELFLPGTGESVSEIDACLAVALSEFNLKEGDVIIIGSADEKIKAELGATAAALELIKTRREKTLAQQGHTIDPK